MSNQSGNIRTTHASPTGSYDPNLIPAETAARIEREGGAYKSVPHADETDNLNTTGGYTVSREGLLNNYAVEPEMYYEERGDRRMQREAIAEQRRQVLEEVQETDEDGKLTQCRDDRGQGPGLF